MTLTSFLSSPATYTLFGAMFSVRLVKVIHMDGQLRSRKTRGALKTHSFVEIRWKAQSGFYRRHFACVLLRSNTANSTWMLNCSVNNIKGYLLQRVMFDGNWDKGDMGDLFWKRCELTLELLRTSTWLM